VPYLQQLGELKPIVHHNVRWQTSESMFLRDRDKLILKKKRKKARQTAAGRHDWSVRKKEVHDFSEGRSSNDAALEERRQQLNVVLARSTESAHVTSLTASGRSRIVSAN